MNKIMKKWAYKRGVRTERRRLQRKVRNLEITQEEGVRRLHVYMGYKKEEYFGEWNAVV